MLNAILHNVSLELTNYKNLLGYDEIESIYLIFIYFYVLTFRTFKNFNNKKNILLFFQFSVLNSFILILLHFFL